MSTTPSNPVRECQKGKWTMPKIAKMRFCFNCGEELGCYADYDPMDDCGKRECARAAQECYAQEREEAHDRLDRDMGWD